MWYVLSQNRIWYNIMNVIKVWTDKHSVTISCHCVVYYHNPSNTPRTDILNDVGVPIRGNVMWGVVAELIHVNEEIEKVHK